MMDVDTVLFWGCFVAFAIAAAILVWVGLNPPIVVV
jgi:hypothetical protein